MEKIPLVLRLKKEMHRRIAFAQDIIIEEVYKNFNNAVLHGGTAIWRCYGGKRFSEDLDFYLSYDKNKIDDLFESFKNKGFAIKKKKISERSIYSEMELDRTNVRFEATFQKARGIITDYEKSEGNFIKIYSLTPEEFIIEKIDTYLKRRKIRDLWDIFFLIKLTKDSNLIRKKIENLIRNYLPPVDEENIKTLILEGITPSSNDMLEYIRKKWENKNI